MAFHLHDVSSNSSKRRRRSRPPKGGPQGIRNAYQAHAHPELKLHVLELQLLKVTSLKRNALIVAEIVKVRFAKATYVATKCAKANVAKLIFAEAQVC